MNEATAKPSTATSAKTPKKYNFYDIDGLKDMFQISPRKGDRGLDFTSPSTNTGAGKNEISSTVLEVGHPDTNLDSPYRSTLDISVNCDDTIVLRSGAGYYQNVLTDFYSLVTPIDLSLADSNTG